MISAARSSGARGDVLELMTHNAKGDVIDAYTSWEWSTLCGELTKLEVDLNPANLIVLPVAKNETPETTAVSGQVFASDFATRDQTEMISGGYRWRRWESNPRPEMVQNDIYVRSLCFDIRDGLRPQTGSHQR
jgi:hypothetical protein